MSPHCQWTICIFQRGQDLPKSLLAPYQSIIPAVLINNEKVTWRATRQKWGSHTWGLSFVVFQKNVRMVANTKQQAKPRHNGDYSGESAHSFYSRRILPVDIFRWMRLRWGCKRRGYRKTQTRDVQLIHEWNWTETQYLSAQMLYTLSV